VLDDTFLAGAYPGRPDPADHRERIHLLFNGGMRTFINLQEENETNNSGVPFVRYDNELRRIARERVQQIAHLRFPIPDGGTTSVDRMRCILDAIDLSLSASAPSTCIASAAWGEPEQPFVVGFCDTGTSIETMFFPC